MITRGSPVSANLHIWLVVWNFFHFSILAHMLGIVISTGFHTFRGVAQPPTSWLFLFRGFPPDHSVNMMLAGKGLLPERRTWEDERWSYQPSHHCHACWNIPRHVRWLSRRQTPPVVGDFPWCSHILPLIFIDFPMNKPPEDRHFPPGTLPGRAFGAFRALRGWSQVISMNSLMGRTPTYLAARAAGADKDRDSWDAQRMLMRLMFVGKVVVIVCTSWNPHAFSARWFDAKNPILFGGAFSGRNAKSYPCASEKDVVEGYGGSVMTENHKENPRLLVNGGRKKECCGLGIFHPGDSGCFIPIGAEFVMATYGNYHYMFMTRTSRISQVSQVWDLWWSLILSIVVVSHVGSLLNWWSTVPFGRWLAARRGTGVPTATFAVWRCY